MGHKPSTLWMLAQDPHMQKCMHGTTTTLEASA
jgi:hypothetical protein